jgi:hypothetical protein
VSYIAEYFKNLIYVNRRRYTYSCLNFRGALELGVILEIRANKSYAIAIQILMVFAFVAVADVRMSFGYTTNYKTSGGNIKVGYNPVAQGYLSTNESIFFLGDLYDKYSFGITSVEFVSERKSSVILDENGLSWKMPMGQYYNIKIYAMNGQELHSLEGVSGGQVVSVEYAELDLQKGLFVIQGSSEKERWIRRVHNY